MKNIFISLVLYWTTCPGIAFADEAGDRAAVDDMVQAFFGAMAERDADAIKSLLTNDGIFYGYREGPDGLVVMTPTHESYANSLAEPGPDLIERLWDPTVLLHDRMDAL